MAGKARANRDDGASGAKRVRKRVPRSGTKRAMNLVLVVAHARKLEGYAVMHDTTVSEIVMDWIEEKTVGMRLSLPGLTVGGPAEGGADAA